MLVEGETVECEYCGKTTTVTEDTKWVSVSYIGCDEEETINLFCSDDCLEKYMRLTEQERMQRVGLTLENQTLAEEMNKPRKNWIKE